MDNKKDSTGNDSSIDEEIKKIYLKIKDLDSSQPRFFQEIMSLQEEILRIEMLESLTGDQKKALQLELSCIEDHIALININKDIEKNPNPSKELLMQQKYAVADITSCMQSLRSTCSGS